MQRPQHLRRAFALVLALLPGAAVMAAPPAAFVQPDPTTQKLPLEAFRIVRDGRVIAAQAQLQPCDKVEFIASQSAVKKVLITTTRGGKNIVLDSARPSVSIACDKVGLGEAASRVWMAISGGDRAVSVPVATKGTPFALPVFASERSNLVAGRRSLFLAWVGGNPPFHLVLKRAATGEVLAELKNLSGASVRIPALDLKPGQYSLDLVNTPTDGSQPGLRESNLFVVDAAQLPARPPGLNAAQLSKGEAELLYVFYLEGLPDGRWVFEAMQRAADIQDTLPAAANWMKSYSAGR